MRAHVGSEQMHHDIAGVDQYPIALVLALDGHGTDSLGLEFFDEMIGHGRDLPLRAARGDDHVIGDGGFIFEIDRNDLFGLVVVER